MGSARASPNVWAMGAEDLRALNPRLVYVHAAGYGADGPYAHRPIYAGVASALAGQVVRHAGTWIDPDFASDLSPVEAQAIVLPRLRGPVDGDANAALAVLSSLLLGIYHQRRTGEGQVVTHFDDRRQRACATPTTSSATRASRHCRVPIPRATGSTRSTGSTRPGAGGFSRRTETG